MKWPLDSRLNLKVGTYLRKHKLEGYGFFVVMTEELHRADNEKLVVGDTQLYAEVCMISEETAEQYLGDLIRLGIFETDSERKYFWSSQVREDVKDREKRREKKSKQNSANAISGWHGRRNDDSQNASAMQNDANECESVRSDAKASDAMQNHANNARGDKNREEESRLEKSKEEELPLAAPSTLTRYGMHYLSMNVDDFNKLVAKFGEPLIRQELLEADDWIARSDTPNGRKYRKPNYNHYLFFNSWLKDKRLKGTLDRGPRKGHVHESGFSENFVAGEKAIQHARELDRLEAEEKL